VAAGTAEASDIIFMPLPPGTAVGPGASRSFTMSAGFTFPGSTTLMGPWTTQLRLGAWAFERSHRWSGVFRVHLWASGPQFRTHGGFLSIVGPGKKWGSVAGRTTNWARIATRTFSINRYWFSGTWFIGTWVSPRYSTGGLQTGGGYYTNSGYRNSHWVTRTYSSVIGHGPFTDQYALFEFQPSGYTIYGWLELSNAVSEHPGSGPDVALVAWAYDSTPGEQIAAGDTGLGSGTPEPSTLALTGLAALALGATGLRRWRAARKPAA
jgi:hypothetical protein